MLFSVIVSVDKPGAMRGALPRASLRRKLRGDYSESEYRYLAEDNPDDPWFKARNWTGSGVLTKTEFYALVEDLDLQAEDCMTLGSLGGPLGGIVPDVAMRNDDPESIVSVRVTPFFGDSRDVVEDEEKAARMWECIRRAFINTFKHGFAGHFSKVPYKARVAWQERHPTSGEDYRRALIRERMKLKRLQREANRAAN